MKRIITMFTVVAAFAAVSTINSCTKTCDAGYEGKDCKTEVRSKYIGQYSLSGSDNGTPAGTYTNLVTTVSTSSVSVQHMNVVINGNISLQIKLSDSEGNFTVTASNVSGYTYTGTGSFTTSSLSFTNLTEVETATNITTVYNLSGPKQ